MLGYPAVARIIYPIIGFPMLGYPFLGYCGLNHDDVGNVGPRHLTDNLQSPFIGWQSHPRPL